MYSPADMPVAPTFTDSLEGKPPIQTGFKRGGRQVNYETLTEDKLRRAMTLYYGAVTLVDDQVGKILEAVESKGINDRTVIAFCSGHGELLGHFGMLTKSIDEFPMLYDVDLRVPMIVRKPGGARGGVCANPVELIDLCPTLLAATGCAVPPEVQGQDLSPLVRGEKTALRDSVYSESGAVKMLRSSRYKLVYYPEQPYGELYDIVDDPHERHNLYQNPEFASVRQEMTFSLLNRLIHTEGTRHDVSGRGPAYWRKLYSVPFEEGDADGT